MYKGIKKLAELILESEEKFLTGQDEQEICLGSLLKSGAQDEIWVSEDGEYHTVMIGNKEEQDNSMQVCQSPSIRSVFQNYCGSRMRCRNS